MSSEKKLAGEQAAAYVEDGMTIGLGTGSTVRYTIEKLGQQVAQGLSIQAVATSVETERLAQQCGIPLVSINETEGLDLAIDGADEVNPHLQLIKGGGGALLREKIIAASARRFIVAADASKLVQQLGRFALPVEVTPFGCHVTGRAIQQLGCEPQLRMNGSERFVTDNGNYIFDCAFHVISNPEQLERALNGIPGVVENGLFTGMADELVTVGPAGEVLIQKREEGK